MSRQHPKRHGYREADPFSPWQGRLLGCRGGRTSERHSYRNAGPLLGSHSQLERAEERSGRSSGAVSVGGAGTTASG